MPHVSHNAPPVDDQASSARAPDEKERRAAELVERLWADASAGLELVIGGKTLWEIRERNARRFLGDMWDTEPPENFEQATINRTQHAIETSASVQIERPWTLDVTAVETDDPGGWWITHKGINKLKMVARDLTDMRTGEVVRPAQVNLEHLNFGIDQLSPSFPLDDDDAQELVLLTEPHVDQMTGQQMPAVLEMDVDIVHLTDAKCAEEMQRIMEVMLEKAHVTLVTHYAQTLCDIHGDQAIMFEWDSDRHLMKLSVPNWTNVRFDPRGFWVSDLNYCLAQQLMPLDQALDEFPKARESLKKAQADGVLQGSGDVSGSQFDESTSSNRFYSQSGNESESRHSRQLRTVVRVRTLWKKTIFDERLADHKKEPQLTEGDESLGMMEEGRAGRSTEQLESGRLTDEPRPSFHPRYGIRQIKVLVETNTVLEDIRCPYPEFPLPYLKNTVIPYSPHGMGDPHRLEDLQNMINRIASYILNTMRMGMFSEQMLPGTVYDFLDEKDSLHRHPGRVIRMDDDLWLEYFSRAGGSSFIIEPPTVDNSWVNLLFGLISQFKELSGDTDALSGQPVSSEASGRLQENVEGAASRDKSYKAATLEHTFEWICRMLLDAIVEWMPDTEIDRYLSRYAGAVREAMRSRMKSGGYDLKVKGAQGRHAHQRMRAQMADAMRARGDITRETYLDMMEHPDPHGEAMRVEEEIRRMALVSAGQDIGSAQDATPGQGVNPKKPNENMRGMTMEQTESPVPRNGSGRL